MRRMWRRQLMAFSRPATPSRLPKTKATVQGGGIWRGYSVDCGPAVQFSIMEIIGAPYGNRTRVSAVKGRRPGPLDEGRSPRAKGAVGRARHIKGFAGAGKQPRDRDIGGHRVPINAASPLTRAGTLIAGCEFSLARPKAGRAAANRRLAARQLAAAAIGNAVVRRS
jgi:hypothetical protein